MTKLLRTARIFVSCLILVCVFLLAGCRVKSAAPGPEKAHEAAVTVQATADTAPTPAPATATLAAAPGIMDTETPAPRAKIPCGSLDLAAANLSDLLREFENQSQPGACSGEPISFSPDQTKALLRVKGEDMRNPQFALYDLDDLGFRWLTAMETYLFVDEVVWSPDSAWIALLTNDRETQLIQIMILKASSGEVQSLIERTTDQQTLCALNLANSRFFSWTGDSQRLLLKVDNAIQQVAAVSGSVLDEIALNDQDLGSSPAEGVWKCGYSLRWSPDGSRLITIGQYPQVDPGSSAWFSPVRLWDTQTGRLIGEGRFSAETYLYEWSPDGKQILLVGNNSAAQLVDAQTLQPTRDLGDPPAEVSNFRWSPDGQWIAAYHNENLAFYQVNPGKWEAGLIQDPDQPMLFAGWMPDSQGILLQPLAIQPGLWVYDLLDRRLLKLAEALAAKRKID